MSDYFFAHLSPDNNTNDIVESIKLPLNDEKWIIAQLSESVKRFLTTNADDGNKEYIIKRV